MAQLYGRTWTRAELSRYVADMAQLAEIRPVAYQDGAEAGVRALEFRTGAGLSFTVLADRCMDVGLAEIDGVPLSFMTGVGYAHPAYYSAHESDWLRTFPGGLFVTGGLDTYGQPAQDGGQAFGLHGRASALPARGLSVARKTAHITYLSEQALQRKFGRSLQNRDVLGFSFDADFQVESYLRHQGSTFVARFDANSYLYITRAMDYFDLAGAHGGVLANAFRGTATRFCLVSFTSDWLFPTRESREIVHALNAAAANVSFVEVESDKGHDAFLLDEPEMFRTLQGFLKGAAAVRGLGEVS